MNRPNDTGVSMQDFDVAVMGGGISGVYSAWRLRQALAARRPNGHLRVTLFECSDRIGGRLFSLKLPGVDGPVELGGMRFLSGHKRVVALVDYFKLAKAELLVSELRRQAPLLSPRSCDTNGRTSCSCLTTGSMGSSSS